MIIINDKRNQIIFSDCLASINIHTDGQRIMATFKEVGTKDGILGKYSDHKKTERAIGLLIRALEQEKEVFYMPTDNDQELNTTITGGQIERRSKITGKTK